MGKKLFTFLTLIGLGVGGALFYKYKPLDKFSEARTDCDPCIDYEYSDKSNIETFDTLKGTSSDCNKVVFSSRYITHKNNIIKIGGKEFNFPRDMISVEEPERKITYYDMKRNGTLDAVVIEEGDEKREYIKFKVTEVRYIHAKTSYKEKKRIKKIPKGRKYFVYVDGELIKDKKLKGEGRKVFRKHERKFNSYKEIFEEIRWKEVAEEKRERNKKVKKYLEEDNK